MSKDDKAAAAIEEERARQNLRELGDKAKIADVNRLKAAQKAYDQHKK